MCQECVEGYTTDRAGASCIVSEEDDGLKDESDGFDLAALIGEITNSRRITLPSCTPSYMCTAVLKKTGLNHLYKDRV